MSKKEPKRKQLADYSIPLGREIGKLQKIEDFKGIDCLLVFGNGSITGRRVKKRTLFGNPIFEYVSINWDIEIGNEKIAPEPEAITNKEEARRYLTNFVHEMEREQYEINKRIIKTPWGYHHIFNKNKYTLNLIINWMKRGCRNEDPKIVGTTTVDEAFEKLLLDNCPEVKKKLEAFEIIKRNPTHVFNALRQFPTYFAYKDCCEQCEVVKITQYIRTLEEFDLLKEVLK